MKIKSRVITILFLIFIISICLKLCRTESISNLQGSIIVCGDSKVLIVENTDSYDRTPTILWSWDAHLANDLPFEYRTKKFNSMDDCKSINKGKQILVSSSSGAIALININDKKVVFYTTVPNAHSIELLPDNKVVAAASTNSQGNKLMVFDLNNPEEVLFTDSLYSAHGVVWDKARKSLFALGYDVLREYKVEDQIKLILKNEWEIPGISGHDLQMAPSGDKLYITEHTGVWFFDINTKQFAKINKFPDAENIKSLNENASGQFVYTVPEESWWTYHVSLHNPNACLYFPNLRVYKARWF